MQNKNRLDDELYRNPEEEQKLCDALIDEQKSLFQEFQSLQRNILTNPHSLKKVYLSNLYKARDQIFFQQIHIVRQLNSQVKLVRDFQRFVVSGDIDNDTLIYSELEQAYQRQNDTLKNYEEFILDLKSHEQVIKTINKASDEIRNEIIKIIYPRILYFLFMFLTPVFYLFCVFVPNNAFNKTVRLANVLEQELNDIEKRREEENERFNIWGEKYSEYTALTMDQERLTRLRSQALETQKILLRLEAKTKFEMKIEQFVEPYRKPSLEAKEARKEIQTIIEKNPHIFPGSMPRIQRLKAIIDQTSAAIRGQITSLEPLSKFLKQKTGETLNELFLVSSDSTNQLKSLNADLEFLYSNELETLALEQQQLINISRREAFDLIQEYQEALFSLNKSESNDMIPFKALLNALISFVKSLDWTWEKLRQLESAIEKNPEYSSHPLLAAVVNHLTRIVMNSEQFKVEKNIAIASLKPDPKVFMQNNSPPLSVQFQNQDSAYSDANDLIKDIMGDINFYQVDSIGQVTSNESKQTTIEFIGKKLLQYITDLSSEDALQPPSHKELVLFDEISSFIGQIMLSPIPKDFKQADIDFMNFELQQYDKDHPIRKSVEFLISLYHEKHEFMEFDIHYAHKELRHDMNQVLKELAAYKIKHQTYLGKPRLYSAEIIPTESTNSLHQWSIVRRLRDLMRSYNANLEKFVSASHPERIQIQELFDPINELTNILYNYKSAHYNKIPELTMSIVNKLLKFTTSHPARDLIEHLISALKQTKEYSLAIAELSSEKTNRIYHSI